MTLILTAPLQKYLPALSSSSSPKDWCHLISESIRQNEEDMTDLVKRIDDHLVILEHQKNRTFDIIAILEEAGGLSIRARNLMATPADTEKYQKNIKEFEDWFRIAMAKLDKAVAESTFQGINLMNGESLITNYDSKGQNKLVTAGIKLTCAELGIREPNFKTLFEVQNSRIDAMNAIDIVVTVRNIIASHMTSLNINRDFAVGSIELSHAAHPLLALSQLTTETTALKKLNDIGDKILGDAPLADPPQQEILDSFASSPNMEDI